MKAKKRKKMTAADHLRAAAALLGGNTIAVAVTPKGGVLMWGGQSHQADVISLQITQETERYGAENGWSLNRPTGQGSLSMSLRYGGKRPTRRR